MIHVCSQSLLFYYKVLLISPLHFFTSSFTSFMHLSITLCHFVVICASVHPSCEVSFFYCKYFVSVLRIFHLYGDVLYHHRFKSLCISFVIIFSLSVSL